MVPGAALSPSALLEEPVPGVGHHRLAPGPAPPLPLHGRGGTRPLACLPTRPGSASCGHSLTARAGPCSACLGPGCRAGSRVGSRDMSRTRSRMGSRAKSSSGSRVGSTAKFRAGYNVHIYRLFYLHSLLLYFTKVY